MPSKLLITISDQHLPVPNLKAQTPRFRSLEAFVAPEKPPTTPTLAGLPLRLSSCSGVKVPGSYYRLGRSTFAEKIVRLLPSLPLLPCFLTVLFPPYCHPSYQRFRQPTN
ncbi:survival factor 1 [Cordyceps militaris]|uniref:Survival factor 1 n=1 Tax=Cordyceps militaris TaxID=73501 RepID=A0A2H4SPR5_CORMI|nr:survival factor 1 [Cordyceps militaris]